jgi:hypothetical protein
LGYNYNVFNSNEGNSHATLKAAYEFSADVYRYGDDGDDIRAKEQTQAIFLYYGMELNYPIWRNVEHFDNSFPYSAVGIGLFFRIGSLEYLYLTTGFYVNEEKFERQLTARDFASAFGVNIPSIIDRPLLDFRAERRAIEFPLLLSFSLGQIKLLGGMLLESTYSDSRYFINGYEVGNGANKTDMRIFVEDRGYWDWTWSLISGLGINSDDAEDINKKFKEDSGINIYWVLGLDYDMMKHWGIGIKFLRYSTSKGEYKPLIVPSNRLRISTYLFI